MLNQIGAGSSQIKSRVELIEEEYPPYPSHVCAPNFVTVKLSGRDKYSVWKTQMLCLLESHDMLPFIKSAQNIMSSSSGKEKAGDYTLWRRSDALVKGWILGSLSEQALVYIVVDADYTAKHVWDKLKVLYGPPAAPTIIKQPPTPDVEEEEGILENSVVSEGANLLNKKGQKKADKKKRKADKEKKEADERAEVHQRLYEKILSQCSSSIELFLDFEKVKVTEKITINGNTALHVAVGTTKDMEIVNLILNLAVKDNPRLDMRNSEGSTPLHVAAIVGNLDAAKILVGKNQHLLFAKDNEGHTPLSRALLNMHTDTCLYLLHYGTYTRDVEMGTLFNSSSGDELLVNAISSKDYYSAIVLSKHDRNLHSDSVLMAIAQNFPEKLNSLDTTFYQNLPKINISDGRFYTWSDRLTKLLYQGRFSYWNYENILLYIGAILGGGTAIYLLGRIRKWIKPKKSPPLMVAFVVMCPVTFYMSFMVKHIKFVKKRTEMHRDATALLKAICSLIKESKDSTCHHCYYTNPIFEATRQNAYEVVLTIVSFFPDAILSTNEDGHNIIQCAVINRSEKVYKLLYQKSEHKNTYRTIRDPFENNLLHLAAKLAPTNKLNLISGAALQIQYELQWFKEVEGFVCPLNIIQRNFFGETPQMVFTREHKELVIEGEKWMKATAESYTITAALIMTIVFAAAITVPGGSDQETGIPMFTKKTAFKVFAISDAISLFTSVTSLLMFLSILTTRFAEHDFLFKLPKRLIIGLTTLFISTTNMIIAFDAALFLLFGQSNSWIIVPIAGLTLLPITSFVTLQFPLISDLMRSTYGLTIFGKKLDGPFF